nr:uncharacterized protein LOC111516960 [Leptinotarsa decemlineata]
MQKDKSKNVPEQGKERKEKVSGKAEKRPKTREKNADPRPTKRLRAPAASSETKSDEGFQRVETKKNKKREDVWKEKKKKKENQQENHADMEMEAETSSKDDAHRQTEAPTLENKNPDTSVWPNMTNSEEQVIPTPASSDSNTNTKQGNPVNPPSIVVHDSKRWNEISKGLEDKKIGCDKARLTRDGIYIHTNNEEEWRRATRYMEERKIDFHTYSIKKGIPLHAVIHGIPENVTVEDVTSDLKAQVYTVLEC